MFIAHFRRQLYSAEARFRSQVSPSEFCGGHCGSGSVFSSNTSVSLCEYYSTSNRYTSTCYCYHEYKRTKLWNLEKKTRREETFDREGRTSIISFVIKALKQGWRTNSTRKNFLATRHSLHSQFFKTSFARPASLYCEEHVCVCVCVCVYTHTNTNTHTHTHTHTHIYIYIDVYMGRVA